MKVGIAKGQLFGGADQRSHGVARGECLLDHEATGAAGGSEDYEFQGLPPDFRFSRG